MENIELQYTSTEYLTDNRKITIRPVRESDGDHPEEIKSQFSDTSIQQRFLGYIPKISKKLIKSLTTIDYKCKMAVVAVSGTQAEEEIIGIARIACENEESVEFAIIIADEWQGKGLASILMDKMIQISRDLDYKTIHAYTFLNNSIMVNMLKKRNFSITKEDNRTVKASLDL